MVGNARQKKQRAPLASCTTDCKFRRLRYLALPGSSSCALSISFGRSPGPLSAGYDGEGGDGGGDGGWLEDGLAACRATEAREDGLHSGGLGRGCVLYMVQRWKA
eukprot:scaffold64545_cov58-Phaeocystis_antarctica.AAC.1